MRQTGEGLERLGDRAAGNAQRTHRSIGRSRVLPVVNTQQGADLGQVDNLGRLLVGVVDQDAVLDIDATGHTPLHRNRNDLAAAAAGKLGVDAAADVVVDADNRSLRRSPAREDAGLGRDVVREVTVALDVVRRDVEQHRDVAHQRADQVELEGGELQHVDAVLLQRLEIEHGNADVAAELHLAARRLQQMRGKRAGCRLAVGTGDAHDPARRARAGKELHVADHLDAGGQRARDQGMGRGMGQRHAGRKHQGAEAVPFDPVEVVERDALFGSVSAARGIVVPGADFRAACSKSK